MCVYLEKSLHAKTMARSFVYINVVSERCILKSLSSFIKKKKKRRKGRKVYHLNFYVINNRYIKILNIAIFILNYYLSLLLFFSLTNSFS